MYNIRCSKNTLILLLEKYSHNSEGSRVKKVTS